MHAEVVDEVANTPASVQGEQLPAAHEGEQRSAGFQSSGGDGSSAAPAATMLLRAAPVVRSRLKRA